MSRLARPAHAAYVDEGSAVFVAPVPAGPIYILEGDAAVIWRAAVGGAEDIGAEVARQLRLDPEVVAGPVGELLTDLQRLGLLVPAPQG